MADDSEKVKEQLSALERLRQQAAAITGEPMEMNGVLLDATLRLQCVGCGNMLVFHLVNDQPENPLELPLDELGCPHCTIAQKRPVVIPVVAAAGDQVLALEELWEEQPPAEPSETPPSPSEAT